MYPCLLLSWHNISTVYRLNPMHDVSCHDSSFVSMWHVISTIQLHYCIIYNLCHWVSIKDGEALKGMQTGALWAIVSNLSINCLGYLWYLWSANSGVHWVATYCCAETTSLDPYQSNMAVFLFFLFVLFFSSDPFFGTESYNTALIAGFSKEVYTQLQQNSR